MFELYVVVAGIVMFNIMELIMEIVSNYPTLTTMNARILSLWASLKTESKNLVFDPWWAVGATTLLTIQPHIGSKIIAILHV
jgi:hypothetical protein